MLLICCVRTALAVCGRSDSIRTNGITNYNSIGWVFFFIRIAMVCNFHCVAAFAPTTAPLQSKNSTLFAMSSSSNMICDASNKDLYVNDCACENIACPYFPLLFSFLIKSSDWFKRSNCLFHDWARESCIFASKIDQQKAIRIY